MNLKSLLPFKGAICESNEFVGFFERFIFLSFFLFGLEYEVQMKLMGEIPYIKASRSTQKASFPHQYREQRAWSKRTDAEVREGLENGTPPGCVL